MNVAARTIRLSRLSNLYLNQNRRFLSTEAGIKDKIDSLVKEKPIVVFMKGVPSQPRCGFSNAVVQIFHMHGVQDYNSHNVLDDDDLREGIKEYSNWPTIPQIYFNGEFIGGCDIMMEMHKNGELIDELAKLDIRSVLADE